MRVDRQARGHKMYAILPACQHFWRHFRSQFARGKDCFLTSHQDRFLNVVNVLILLI